MSSSSNIDSPNDESEINNANFNFSYNSENDLENAIEKCKETITQYNGDNIIPNKWVVRRLIELRLRLIELKESFTDSPLCEEMTQKVNGHSFKILRQPKKIICDNCSNIIWIFQMSYNCTDCSYTIHVNCLKYETRICAHIIVTELKIPEYRICPEIGLSNQGYRCAQCKVQLMNKLCYLEPRKCYYSGLYYCKNCHWKNYSIIPANIIHNWDFEQRMVSRQSLQIINLFYERPVIKLEVKLFAFVQKLANVKRIRSNLKMMKMYLDVCRLALDEKILPMKIGKRRHLIENTDFYSIYDCVAIENNSLYEFLSNIYDSFNQHIINCKICSGQAFLCELCGNDEKIYPFNEGTHQCKKCKSCTHYFCYTKSNQICLKCKRLELKTQTTDLLDND